MIPAAIWQRRFTTAACDRRPSVTAHDHVAQIANLRSGAVARRCLIPYRKLAVCGTIAGPLLLTYLVNRKHSKASN